MIRADTLADGVPRRDLMVSPKHAMFFDGVLVPAEKLIDGSRIVRGDPVDTLDYLHLDLGRHEVIFAEGAATESFVDCDSRFMFQNAGEFATLYPGPGGRGWQFCAPRIEEGNRLSRVRQTLAARAARLGWGAGEGSLDGRVDTVGDGQVTGWAFDATRPNAPVWLEILDRDRVIGECLADRYRPDLARAGIGSGCCSFVFALPGVAKSLIIRARRKSDGADVPSAPITWQRPVARANRR
jgi:hypothetical protein